MWRFETRSGYMEIGDGRKRVEGEEEDGEEDDWRQRGSHDRTDLSFSLCLVIQLIYFYYYSEKTND